MSQPDPAAAVVHVSGVRIDDEGITAHADGEVIVDVNFDGRRIWSFWLHRDGTPVAGGHQVGWPTQLRSYLNGVTRLSLTEHVEQRQLYDADLSLGNGEGRIAVVNAEGKPLGIDKSNRIAQTFDTRSPEQVAPLLDSIQNVLAAIMATGIEAFPAYGTLLGAVRGGQLIGHDSDADLGYVSRHEHPVDVMRESFALQRKLAEAGYETHRYSGGAFKVDVVEADGSLRGLDVFGGFITGRMLYLMGEVGCRFEREWIFPLGTCTLEGRTLPAPAVPEKLLEATYGPGWQVPDPAYHFSTPRTTVRRLNGWFRGTRVFREDWDRRYSRRRAKLPPKRPSSLARFVVEQEGLPDWLVELGAGRGGDSLWFARQGVPVTAFDYVPWAAGPVQEVATSEGLGLEVAQLNLTELRSTLGVGARLAHAGGARTLMARHLVDATNDVGRKALWRVSEMALRGGGRLYLDFLSASQEVAGVPGVRGEDHLRPLDAGMIERELEERGAVVVHREDLREDVAPGESGRPIRRMVAQWAS